MHQLSCEPLRDETGQAQCFQATSVVLRKPGQPDEVEKALNAVGAARIAGMVSLSSSAKRCPMLWPLVGAKAPSVGLPPRAACMSLASAPIDELNLPPISAESFFAEELGAFGLQAQLSGTDAAKPVAIYSACLRPPAAASDSLDSDSMGIGVSLDTVVAAPLEDFELLVRSAAAIAPSLPAPPHAPAPATTTTTTTTITPCRRLFRRTTLSGMACWL